MNFGSTVRAISLVISMSFVLGSVGFAQTGEAIDDAEHFPDRSFRAQVKRELGTGFTAEDAAAFTGSLDLDGSNISDLTGIEYFSNLTELLCNDNALTSMDLSENTNLAILECNNNQLTSITLPDDSKLEFFYCDG